jgi:reprolysin-like metallo-peptidase family M12B/S-layer family protein
MAPARMRTSTRTALLCACVLLTAAPGFTADAPSPFRDVLESALPAAGGERVLHPLRYRLLRLDRDALLETLAKAPLEFAGDDAGAIVLALPMPDGSSARFRVLESPILEPGLARQFPRIRTYRGQGIDDGTATARFGWTSAGFHAIVLASSGTVYVDPYRRGDTVHYLSYFKRDYRAPAGDRFRCLVDEVVQDPSLAGPPAFTPSGDILRTYRLALATTVEYSDFHSNASPPDKADVMNNGLVPTINRVNAVYERDVAVRMVLIANEAAIIHVVEPDPYTNGNPAVMLAENQASLDTLIGDANYDIGHAFGTGGGGVARLFAPCIPGWKAQGATGRPQPTGDPFDIDYVSHEMGHQFGANHIFNSAAGFCGANRQPITAYEVGSGSSIMSYSGLCSPDNLQTDSDDHFHNKSFEEIQSYVTGQAGDSCSVHVSTGNQPPVVDAGPAFTIPSRTPFALTASGSDPDGDPLTFAWEEFDLGPAGDGRTDNGFSPILRPFRGTPIPTRIFPRLSDILSNSTTYGELLPTTTRTMTFRVTARDNRAGGGGVDWDATTVSVAGTAGPFQVTSPNANVLWFQGSTQTITWDVAGTDAPPIGTADVEIRLSTDHGVTFPIVLAASTANDGARAITVPAVMTGTARVQVSAVGNVFFDISDQDFSIQPLPAALAEPAGLAVDAAGNGVLQPNEASIVAPSWRNIGGAALSGASGTLAGFNGGSVPDGAASYGTIAVGATGSCAATGDCYAVTPSATRPAIHWDAVAVETFAPTGVTQSWTLHVGGSFNDVPGTSPFLRFVETLLHRGITAGCSGTHYCPSASTTRGQMAVFVLVAREAPGYTPVACTTPIFADVPASSPFCRWIEELARRNVVSGCGSGNYCPASPVTREQMAIFVLRTLDPALNPVACGLPVFGDVPASSPFCRWIEELVRRGVVAGCGGGDYCPAAAVTREQMSVFLGVTFGLALYGL